MGEFERIFRGMDDFFDRLFDQSVITYLPYTAPWQPPLDLFETPRSFWVVMGVPGLDRSEIEITVEGNCLVVQGVKRSDAPPGVVRCRHMELPRGAFRRVLTIHAPIKKAIKARYRQGLLIIEIPKKKA